MNFPIQNILKTTMLFLVCVVGISLMIFGYDKIDTIILRGAVISVGIIISVVSIYQMFTKFKKIPDSTYYLGLSVLTTLFLLGYTVYYLINLGRPFFYSAFFVLIITLIGLACSLTALFFTRIVFSRK